MYNTYNLKLFNPSTILRTYRTGWVNPGGMAFNFTPVPSAGATGQAGQAFHWVPMCGICAPVKQKRQIGFTPVKQKKPVSQGPDMRDLRFASTGGVNFASTGWASPPKEDKSPTEHGKQRSIPKIA